MASKVPALQRTQAIREWTIDRRRLYLVAKRLMDLVLATTALVVFAPLLLFLAVLIKLDSKGPVLFKQRRMGYNEGQQELKPFTMLKFRSMVNGVSQAVHEEHVRRWVRGEISPEAGDVKLVHDVRVTRIGHLLRATSLDELPQLINVLRGEMSLVGPRPVPLYEVAEYQPRHLERLHAIPGMTGLWQVRARSQVTIDGMTELDCEYVRNRSLRMDIQILASTIPAVLSGRGAG